MIKNIAIFASGKGTNFSAIVAAVSRKLLQARIALLVCDNPQAPVIKKANRAGVRIIRAVRKDFATKKDFEAEIIRGLKEEDVDLIVLAGFMRILSPDFVRRYKNRIINIHPSLLPAFKGAHAIKEAFHYGVKLTGVTIHFVDEKIDHGPIILQTPVAISSKDTLESLEDKIHTLEHSLYPHAIQLLLKGKLKLSGRKVKTP
ncbi:MAG: phosphoribosylglycinamide formyltransferase [Candidatus Omnitrophota bacterium]